MSLRTLVIVFSALGCAGLAAFGVSRMLARKVASVPSATVIVVAADLPRGAILAEGHVSASPFPESMLPPGAITRLEDAIGRTALGQLHRGEVLMESKVAVKGSKGGIAGLIPPGMRAIAVQTPNVATGVAGFILPGNKVDVLITMNGVARDGTDAASTVPILENVEILAVDQRVDAPSDNQINAAQMRSVTLLVTPEQASRLNLGMTRGTLHLSLRNPTDDRVTIARPAVLRDIRPEPSPPPAPVAVAAAPSAPPAPTLRKLRLVRGMNEAEVHFLDHGPVPARIAGSRSDPEGDAP